jgi:hypothetical protein
MALAQQFDDFVANPSRAQPVLHNNVIPFPKRVTLTVTLPRESDDSSGEQLRLLLRSPVGIYVMGTEIVRNEIRVQLDIAPEDLPFTLHTLIAALPKATIGPVERRGATAKVR